MENPKVSVIVPNYNHEKYLRERIDSILKQTYQNFELIILDDCSKDDSRKIIETYRSNPHVSHIVLNEQNTGSPFRQWDKGIELSSGELIWIAESDDYAHREFLSTLVTQMDNHPEAVIAFSHSILVDSNGNDLGRNMHSCNDDTVFVHHSQSFTHGPMLTRNDIYNASMVVFRREAFDNVEKSYQNYRSCGDWAFWMGICIQGDVIEVCCQLSYFRQHEDKVTSHAGQTGNDWREVASILNNFIKLLNLRGLSLRLFRGRWTKYFRESHFPDKKSLQTAYPAVFAASSFDVFLFRASKLLQKK